MSFTNWVDNMDVPQSRRPELLDRLLSVESGLADFLEPSGGTADDVSFALTEGLVVAVKR